MAARKNKGIGDNKMPQTWREKIREGVLSDLLMKHANGEREMSATQIKAADILLKKVVPDLARTEHTGKDGAAIEHKDVTLSDAEIIAKYKQQQESK